MPRGDRAVPNASSSEAELQGLRTKNEELTNATEALTLDKTRLEAHLASNESSALSANKKVEELKEQMAMEAKMGADTQRKAKQVEKEASAALDSLRDRAREAEEKLKEADERAKAVEKEASDLRAVSAGHAAAVVKAEGEVAALRAEIKEQKEALAAQETVANSLREQVSMNEGMHEGSAAEAEAVLEIFRKEALVTQSKIAKMQEVVQLTRSRISVIEAAEKV